MSETFGRYTVLGQLGKGAMGIVYLASDPMLNRQVAVKTVDLSVQEPSEREFLRERLLRDARAAAVLKHPNIVAIYDVFEDANRAYVVMEYIEGDSLAARLRTNPHPDASAMLKVLREMAAALDYTHARGVIHRDIKPANVMIDSTGTTKIMDFGIARISDSRTCTPTGMVMGTVEYMAPEQILGEALDGRADQFALAVVAYQMMTGGTLYGPHTVATLTYKIVHEAPPLPRSRNASLPRGVDLVLAKGLAKKPTDRFATCSDFVSALETAFSEAPTGPIVAARESVAAGAIPMSSLRTDPTSALPTRATAPASDAPEYAPAESGGHSKTPILVAAIAVLVLAGALAAVIFKPWAHPQPTTGAVTPGTTNPPAAGTPAAHSPTPAKTGAASSASGAAGVKKEPDTGSKSTPSKTPSVSEQPAPVVAEPSSELDTVFVPKEKTQFAQALERGQQQVKNNDYQGALASFTQAEQLRPKNVEARYVRGTVLLHLQQYDEAMREYTEAIQINPNYVVAYTGLGNCLAAQRRDAEALVEYQRALEKNPRAPFALFGRANIYYRRKEFGAALADYDKVIEIKPAYAPAYMNRAHAREAIGDMAGAAADKKMEQSLRNKP